MKKIAVVVAGALLATPTCAEMTRTMQMEDALDVCVPEKRHTEGHSFCMGILNAAAYMVSGYRPEVRSCIPSDVTEDEYTTIALLYAKEHYGRLKDIPFAITALAAWHERWPCR